MDYTTNPSTLGAMRAKGLLFLCLLMLAALPACKKMGQIGELAGIQMIINKQFEEPGAAVAPAEDKSVVIVLRNSKKDGLPDEERKAYAKQIAEVIRDSYSGYGQLNDVQVVFMNGGALKPTPSGNPYIFTTAELGAPVPKPKKP